jgi:hypothetical protein
MDVASICDPTIRFVTQSVDYKLSRKCRKDQVPLAVIVTVEQCVEGVHMNWATFLLNQFFIDCEEAWDKGT